MGVRAPGVGKNILQFTSKQNQLAIFKSSATGQELQGLS